MQSLYSYRERLKGREVDYNYVGDIFGHRHHCILASKKRVALFHLGAPLFYRGDSVLMWVGRALACRIALSARATH